MNYMKRNIIFRVAFLATLASSFGSIFSSPKRVAFWKRKIDAAKTVEELKGYNSKIRAEAGRALTGPETTNLTKIVSQKIAELKGAPTKTTPPPTKVTPPKETGKDAPSDLGGLLSEVRKAVQDVKKAAKEYKPGVRKQIEDALQGK